MGRLDDKVALITGAARGQGRAIALKFAAEGADIVICDVCSDLPTVEYPLADSAELEETRAAVSALGRRCIAEVVDVRDQEALDALVARAVTELGRIDIVCPNAGIVSYGMFWELDEETWQVQLDVNLTGVWHTVKAVAPQMIEHCSGSIIFTSSTNGREAGPNNSHYTVTKHGVVGLMKAVAVELGGYGVRANAILPGPVMSPMIDNEPSRHRFTGRHGTTTEDLVDATRKWVLLRGQAALPPEAVADAMIWLASDESASVTGIELPVDAGHLALAGLNLGNGP
jgi:SDR family mycofactocin-dependent oxidoreductase